MECGVTPNKMAEEDYIHARLYAFVEKYGVSALRALALSKHSHGKQSIEKAR